MAKPISTPELEEAFLAHAYDPVKAHQYYETHKHLKGRHPATILQQPSPQTHKHHAVALAKQAKAGLGHEKRRAINEETNKAKAALTKLTAAFRDWVKAHPNASAKEKEAQRVRTVAAKSEVLKNFRQTIAKISTPNGATAKEKSVKPADLQTIRHEITLDQFYTGLGLTGGSSTTPVDQLALRHDDSTDSAPTLAAIMAVPRDLDPIRLVGDEDKHATILYFGDIATLPQEAKGVLLDIVVQAARMTMPFSERVIATSRFGSENPPALAAMLSSRFLDQIRSSLQITPQVRDYLRNTSQFPQFTPHVTLGYPDYEGEAALRELMNSLFRVQFDRLSLWWGSEHFDVPLMGSGLDEPGDAAEAAWGENTRIGNFLEHHGIRGMRWGVRRDRGSDGTVSSAHGGADAIHDHGGNLSADAERAVHTLQKTNAERSTREMKEAIDRFNQIQAYNKIFNPEANGHSAIQRKIDGLKQQKELRQLQADLKPPSRVDKLIKRSTQAFSAFQAVDKVMGGTLSDGLVSKMGLKTVSEHETTKSAVDLLKLKNDLLSEQARSIRNMAALNQAHVTNMPTPIAGKHRGPTPGGGRHSAPTAPNPIKRASQQSNQAAPKRRRPRLFGGGS